MDWIVIAGLVGLVLWVCGLFGERKPSAPDAAAIEALLARGAKVSVTLSRGSERD